MYRFEHQEYLMALLLLLFPIAVIVVNFLWRKKQLSSWFSTRNLRLSIPGFSSKKVWIKSLLQVAILALLIFTLANPLAGKKVNRQIESKGNDIQIVADISNSMLCEDVKPDRLTRMKQILLGMIDRMGSDRAGLVVFAGDAYIQLPMTIDQTAVSMFVRNLEPELITQQGTNIETALQTALVSIDSSHSKYPAIVLLSDGEGFEGDPASVITTLKQRNIPVHTVAIGTEKGGPVPIYKGGFRSGYKKDSEGNTVITKPDVTLLEQLAKETDGLYIAPDQLGGAAESIMNELDRREGEESRSMEFSDYHSLYLWFLIPALLLLFFERLIVERRTRFQDTMKHFIERRSL